MMRKILSKLFDQRNTPKGPALLIIGAQKGGTTNIYNSLNSRHEFCGPKIKEVHFFDRDAFYKRGIDWYHTQFVHCKAGKIILEATPSYIYKPFVPERLYSYCQRVKREIKFLVMLREPVSRAYSAWNMYRRFNQNNPMEVFEKFIQYANPIERFALEELLFSEKFPTFEQAVLDDIKRHQNKSELLEPSFVRRGIYYAQIQRWLKYFNRDQFLFLEMNELNKKGEIIHKISQFMNVKLNMDNLELDQGNKNQGTFIEKDNATKKAMDKLKQFYFPYNKQLYDLIGERYNWNDLDTGIASQIMID